MTTVCIENLTFLKRAYLNDTVVQESEGQGGEHTYACSDETVGNRPLVVFKNGEVAAKSIGVQSKEEVLKLLDA